MAEQSGIIGKTVGKCRILGRLGHGKTSRIFRALYEPLRKEVAVKILKEDMQASEEIRRKFLNEARAIARLDHENIVKVFDVLEDRGHLLIIMELLKGEDCYSVLENEGPFTPERAVQVVTEAARALESSHRQGIVHRDVKPANIMLTGRRGRVKLLDFGLAAEGVTAGKAGTPAYMSPEQIRGKKIDEKSDIYSLGATFYHLLTGRPPYTGRTAKEILRKHLEGKLPTPSRARVDPPVPKVLDPIVKRMMAPVPGYRYPARDLVAALGSLNLEARAVRHHRHAARAASRRKSPVPLLAAAAGGLVLLGVLLVLLLTSGGTEATPPPDRTPTASSVPDAAPTGDVNILNRASARQNLEAMARRDFERAASFEARNIGKYDEIIPKYEAIYEQYGATSWGLKAREKTKELVAKRDAAKIAAERSAREKAMREARVALDEDLKEPLRKYDFAGAREKILEFMDEHGEPPDLVERYNWLGYAADLLYTMAEELALGGGEYPVSWFKPRYSEDAVIKKATPEGLVIEDRGIEKKVGWSFFEPREVRKLAGRLFRSSDIRKQFLVASFLFALGRDAEGRNALDRARMLDRMGILDRFLEEVRGGKRKKIRRPR